MKLFRITSKRGLGTVVTAVILLSAVAMMGTFLVGWSNSNLITHQSLLEASFSDKMNKLNEHLAFEYVWFGDTPKIVNVTLTNVGTIGLNVTEVEFTDTSGTTLATFPITGGGIVPSQTYSLEEPYDWTSGTPFNVVATTGRTNIYQTQVLPP